ncbi:Cardiolipin synthase [uncultured Clostridium sp.]|nr:Cardiolipin synthase [uncultured Clostridium sp.]
MIIATLSILVHILNIITIIYMIFKEKRSANSIISWALILTLLPYIGFILFLLIGRKIKKSDIFIMKKSKMEFFKTYTDQLDQMRISNDSIKNSSNYEIIRAIESMEYSPYRNNNEVELFFDGKELFNEILDSLRKAEKSINIQFYIFKDDEIGSQILKILKEKAKSGVEVRLLYDSVGSRSLTNKKLKSVIDAGVKTGEFFPAILKLVNLNMNFRNHRKIIVIDNKIGFVGGFNVGDEYLGKDPKFGYWRDTHIKFDGSAVKDLNLRFLSDWNYATKENIDLTSVLKDFKSNTIYDFNYSEPGIQIISSGPNPYNRYEIKWSYLEMIQKAKDYIYIQSPYLILDQSIADSLKLASISGVDIKIMIPGKGDHPFVYWANLVYAGELLNFGIEIYHYDKNAFLHSKTVVIDDRVCSIGTANMDTRSCELNFEVNALIYCEDIAKKQREQFEKDMLLSNRLTLEEYNNRSNYVKIKEGFSKLFSSLL